MKRILNFTRTASILFFILLLLRPLPIFAPGTEMIQLLAAVTKLILLLAFFGIFINETERNATLRPYAIAGLVGMLLQIASIFIQFALQRAGAYHQLGYAGIISMAGWIFVFVFFWRLGGAVAAGTMRTCARLTAVLLILILLIQNFLPPLILTVREIAPENLGSYFTMWGALFSTLEIAVYAWFFLTFYRQFK